MKVAIYTVDLFPGRERLMPWRTFIELSEYLINKKAFEVEIISVIKEKAIDSYKIGSVPVKAIENNKDVIITYLNANKFDCLLYQLKWRDGLKDIYYLKKINCKKIAYFDGGVYSVKNTFKLLQSAGLRIAKPYLLESLVPKKMLIRCMQSIGFTNTIGMTPYTTNVLNKYGCSNATTIMAANDFDVKRNDNKNTDKYFLFTGAPALTRGSIELLHAFDKFASKYKDAKMIFLMRKDVGSNFTFFEHELSKLKNKHCVQIIRQNLSPEELRIYFSDARAVVLPFLVIPSEIPITYFEVLATGTPVITFTNGGTTKYLKDALIIAKHNNVCSLKKAMESAWVNDELIELKTRNALKLMLAHPTWSDVNEQWYNVILK